MAEPTLPTKKKKKSRQISRREFLKDTGLIVGEHGNHKYVFYTL